MVARQLGFKPDLSAPKGHPVFTRVCWSTQSVWIRGPDLRGTKQIGLFPIIFTLGIKFLGQETLEILSTRCLKNGALESSYLSKKDRNVQYPSQHFFDLNFKCSMLL